MSARSMDFYALWLKLRENVFLGFKKSKLK